MRPRVLPKFGRCSRRALLGSSLGGLFLAPFLRQRALEAKATLPRRLILAYTPDSHPREWWPTPTETGGFTLGGSLLDFVGLEQHLLFVRQVDHSWTEGMHHGAGMAQLFTGQHYFDDATKYAAGPSIDQVLLARTDLRGMTPISDAHLAVADMGGGDHRSVMCYSGPGQPIVRTSNPFDAYVDLFDGVSFAGASGSGSTNDLEGRIKRAILGVDSEQIKRIQGFLGQDERARLELHLQALGDLEAALDRTESAPAVPAPPGCSPVDTSGVTLTDREEASVTHWSEVTLDLVVAAFLCDRTRVVELGFGASGSHHSGLFDIVVDPANSWHDVAHRMIDDGRRQEVVTVAGQPTDSASAYVMFDRFWASQIAALAHRLDAIPEGDGSMLDNTLIYWGTECGTDHNHGPSDMPYLLIGGKNLGIQGGRMLTFPEPQSAHKLHTSVLRAFGYTDAQGFGIEESCGPLEGVLA